MTDKSMLFQDLIEKSSDSDFLREMIGFAADRLMALELKGCAARATGSAAQRGRTSATATAIVFGRPGRGRLI